MAKTKESKHSEEIIEEASDGIFRMSARQLFDSRKARQIIPLTLSMDIALSGGIPLGSTILIGGKAKIGKTTIALQYAANAQKLYGSKVFFFPIEGRLDNKVLSQIRGINLDDMTIILGDPIRDKDGKIVQHKKMPAEWWWTQIGDTILKNPKCIIIVDSISALSDEKELSEEFGYQSRGGAQKLESQFVRKYGDSIVSSGVVLFLLCQIIANTSGYGPSVIMRVGSAVRHLCDGLLFCKGAEKWTPGSDGRILGHDINVSVDVNPLGSPYTETFLGLRFGYGLDTYSDLIKHCINWQIIQKGGSWFCLPYLEEDDKIKYIDITEMDLKKTDLKLIKMQGEENIRNWLLLHTNQYNELNNIIKKKIFG